LPKERREPIEQGMPKFKSTLPVTEAMIGILNLSKSIKLDDGLLFRQYILQKGVPVIDLVDPKLSKMKEPFDK
jgi:hypothetical protein